MIGSHGKPFANRVMNESDLIILCGARVGDRAVSAPSLLEAHAKIIHIDIDPAEIGKNLSVDVPIVGDIKKVLAELAEKVQKTSCDEWISTVLEYKNSYIPRGEPRDDFVEPRAFVRDLSAMMEEEAILTADVGQNQIWAANNFNVKEGRVSHLRRHGYHGLCPARRHWGQAGKATPPGGGHLRRRVRSRCPCANWPPYARNKPMSS